MLIDTIEHNLNMPKFVEIPTSIGSGSYTKCGKPNCAIGHVTRIFSSSSKRIRKPKSKNQYPQFNKHTSIDLWRRVYVNICIAVLKHTSRNNNGEIGNLINNARRKHAKNIGHQLKLQDYGIGTYIISTNGRVCRISGMMNQTLVAEVSDVELINDILNPEARRDVYLLTWAKLGYTEGMPEKVLNMLLIPEVQSINVDKLFFDSIGRQP